MYLSDEYPEWKAFSPNTVGGAPNLLCLRDDDFETLFQQAVDFKGVNAFVKEDKYEPTGAFIKAINNAITFFDARVK